MDKLKVRAADGALVADLEAQEIGIRRFIGRKLVAHGDSHAFESTGEVEVPNNEFYRDAVKTGGLEAVDEATAKACGVVRARSLAPGEVLEDVANGGQHIDASELMAVDIPNGTTKKKGG